MEDPFQKHLRMGGNVRDAAVRVLWRRVLVECMNRQTARLPAFSLLFHLLTIVCLACRLLGRHPQPLHAPSHRQGLIALTLSV